MVQRACRAPAAPDTGRIQTWAEAAFRRGAPPDAELEMTVRIVDEAEARALNHRYRGRDYAPNVLSFPMMEAGPVATGMLGDVVICAAVLAREAAAQGKDQAAHWAHLVVHGVLHCCGYAHDAAAEAERMESLEARILAEFGFPDPYTPSDEQ